MIWDHVLKVELGEYTGPERPALPTSREPGGVEIEALESACSVEVFDSGHDCGRDKDHSGHHVCFSRSKVCGRWYTDGPFTEAK